jgi:hypothetical protein
MTAAETVLERAPAPPDASESSAIGPAPEAVLASGDKRPYPPPAGLQGIRFDYKDFLRYPRQAGTPRQFECTRLTAETAIRRIPGFGKHPAALDQRR